MGLRFRQGRPDLHAMPAFRVAPDRNGDDRSSRSERQADRPEREPGRPPEEFHDEPALPHPVIEEDRDDPPFPKEAAGPECRREAMARERGDAELPAVLRKPAIEPRLGNGT